MPVAWSTETKGSRRTTATDWTSPQGRRATSSTAWPRTRKATRHSRWPSRPTPQVSSPTRTRRARTQGPWRVSGRPCTASWTRDEWTPSTKSTATIWTPKTRKSRNPQHGRQPPRVWPWAPEWGSSQCRPWEWARSRYPLRWAWRKGARTPTLAILSTRLPRRKRNDTRTRRTTNAAWTSRNTKTQALKHPTHQLLPIPPSMPPRIESSSICGGTYGTDIMLVLSTQGIDMQTQHKSTPASSLARKTLGLPFAAVMALSMTGCSGDGGSPKAESLCDGAVSSVAEIALAEMTGASPLSSETGGTPERLREEALGAETEDDPWSDFTSWSCSVSPANDQDGENRIGVSVRWFPSSISFISSEAKKGSKEYLEISPSTFTG